MQISQPSLSIKIKKLEEALEITLLKRSHNGVRLTHEGHKALHYTKNIIQEAQNLKKSLENKNTPYQGYIRIGIYDSIARYFWPKFFKQFSKLYPGISLELTTGRSQYVLDKLRHDLIDMAITVEPKLGTAFKQKTMYHDKLSLFASKNFVNEYKSSEKTQENIVLSFDENVTIPIILFSNATIGDNKTLESEIKLNLKRDFIIHDVENFEISKEFCLEGIGIAVLPNNVATQHLEKGELLKVQIEGFDFKNASEHRVVLSASNRRLGDSLNSFVFDTITNYQENAF